MKKFIFDPVYTSRDTRKCITHFALDECARHVLNTYDDAFVYYLRPAEHNHIFEEELAELFPGRVKYFDGKYRPNNRVYEFLWRPDWLTDILAPTGFAWDWDVLVSTRGPAHGYLRWLNSAKAHSAKKVVIHDHFPIFKFKSGAQSIFGVFPEMELTTLTSYLLADYVVPEAKYEIKGIMKAARKWLSPSAQRLLKDKLIARFPIPRDLDTRYVLKKEAKKKGEKVVGIFTQRIGMSGRHPNDVLESFFYPFVKTKKGQVEFQLSTNSLMDLPEDANKRYSFVTFNKSLRSEFYERLRQSDFCISFSTTEGMPTSILEAIIWGCIPILVDAKWSRDMVGPDWPFCFKGFPQAVAMVKKIALNHAEAHKVYQDWYREWFIPYLDEVGNLQEIMDRAWADNEKSLAVVHDSDANEIVETVIDYATKKGLEKFTISDIFGVLYKQKLIRTNPATMKVGQATQYEMGKCIPVMHPKYYQHLHGVLRHSGWKRGLEPGEVIPI